MSDSPDTPLAGSDRLRRPVRFAVAGLVLAVVPCCPFTGLIGAFLGLIALRRLGPADPAAGPRHARGRRLAIAAVIVGLASAVIWSEALRRLESHQATAQEETIATLLTEAVSAAEAGDAGPLRRQWSTVDGAAPTADDVTSFGRAFEERYGRLDRVSIVSTARGGTFRRPTVEVAGVFHSSTASPLGSARIELRMIGFQAKYFIGALTIEDADRGDLTLTGPAPAPAP